jgi:hypothetical protein
MMATEVANGSKTGDWVNYTFVILSGEREGQSYYQLYNYNNPSLNVQRGARRDLSFLCVAVGMKDGTTPDMDAVLNVPFRAKIGLNWDKKSNTITKYGKSQGQPQQPAQAVVPPQGGGFAPEDSTPF